MMLPKGCIMPPEGRRPEGTIMWTMGGIFSFSGQGVGLLHDPALYNSHALALGLDFFHFSALIMWNKLTTLYQVLFHGSGSLIEWNMGRDLFFTAAPWRLSMSVRPLHWAAHFDPLLKCSRTDRRAGASRYEYLYLCHHCHRDASHTWNNSNKGGLTRGGFIREYL